MKKLFSLFLCIAFTVLLSVPVFAAKFDYLKIISETASVTDLEYLSEGFLLFSENGKQGIMKYDGTVCIEATYERIEGLYYGLLRTYGPDGYLKVDENYSIVEEDVSIEDVTNSVIVFDPDRNEALLAYFDMDGNFAFSEELDEEMFPCVVRKAKIEDADGEKVIAVLDLYGYMTDSQTVSSELVYENALQFENGFALKKNGLWAYFNGDGSEITGFNYSDTYTYVDALGDTLTGVYAPSEGLIAVNKRQNYGFISASSGADIVPFVFDKLLPSFAGESFACADGVWAKCSTTEIPPQITSINILGFEGENIQIQKGSRLKLVFETDPEGADPSGLVWTSSDTSIAIVSAGTVTAIGTGEVTVSAYNVFGDFVGGYTFTIASGSGSAGSGNGGEEAPQKPSENDSSSSASQNAVDNAVEDPIMIYSIFIGIAAMTVTAIILVFTTRAKRKREALNRRRLRSERDI